MKQAGNLPEFHLGLIGYPLGHSFSPRLHTAALVAAGLRGSYQLFPVPPDSDGQVLLRALFDRMRAGELDGLNVTIPHKQAVLGLVDSLSETARAVGAVNTLFLQKDRLIGDNTDVPGFLYDLGRLKMDKGRRAVLLGAGGSARPVAFALASRGWPVKILARRIEQARALAADIGAACRHPEILTAEELSIEQFPGLEFDLLVNTTPVGMHPNPDGCPWPENVPLPSGAAVYDLVYNPSETRLVRLARSTGLTAASGVGMLVAQAALSFQRWTGVAAPFQVMEQAFFEPQRAGEE